jgi:hypothetical protein
MAWTLAHVIDGEYHVFDEIIIPVQAKTTDALDELHRRYKDHKGSFCFYGDMSAGANHTCAQSTDVKQIDDDVRFRSLGRKIDINKFNPPQEDRINIFQSLVLNGVGQRRLKIHPRCTLLIKDIKNVRYKPGTRKLWKDKYDGHAYDACGYAACKLFPLYQPQWKAPTFRFGE